MNEKDFLIHQNCLDRYSQRIMEGNLVLSCHGNLFLTEQVFVFVLFFERKKCDKTPMHTKYAERGPVGLDVPVSIAAFTMYGVRNSQTVVACS